MGGGKNLEENIFLKLRNTDLIILELKIITIAKNPTVIHSMFCPEAINALSPDHFR